MLLSSFSSFLSFPLISSHAYAGDQSEMPTTGPPRADWKFVSVMVKTGVVHSKCSEKSDESESKEHSVRVCHH